MAHWDLNKYLDVLMVNCGLNRLDSRSSPRKSQTRWQLLVGNQVCDSDQHLHPPLKTKNFVLTINLHFRFVCQELTVTNVMYRRCILGNGFVCLMIYDKLNGSIGKECHQHFTRGNGRPATASCPLHILIVLPMFLRCFISLAPNC